MEAQLCRPSAKQTSGLTWDNIRGTLRITGVSQTCYGLSQWYWWRNIFEYRIAYEAWGLVVTGKTDLSSYHESNESNHGLLSVVTITGGDLECRRKLDGRNSDVFLLREERNESQVS